MSLKRRLIIKFLISIFTLFALLLLVDTGLLFMANKKHAPEPAELLQKVSASTTANAGSISVLPETLLTVEKSKGWIQILDEGGNEVYKFNKPESLPVQYSPGQLVYYNKSPQATGYHMYTWYSSVGDKQLTWIYGTRYNAEAEASDTDNYRNLAVLMFLNLLLTIIIALFYGIHLGTPLLHILRWIDNISKGSYMEPINNRGFFNGRISSSGSLSKSYETYQEIILAIENLSNTLKINDEKKAILDKSREEWIAGVSHDIKTPLSSVKGYADLLVSNQYDFSKEEISGFSRIISEKAAYIEDLIEDLNLTFRLKNKSFIVNPKPQNIVEIIRTSVIEFVNDQRYSHITVMFNNGEDDRIDYPVDSKWLKRAFDNLLANSLLHNEAGTTVTVYVEKVQTELKYPMVTVNIIDTGNGMDKETLEHFFDRYYRGTNTDESNVKGSGLGTAIARQLIEEQGGSISAKSSPGNGTKLHISLPAKN